MMDFSSLIQTASSNSNKDTSTLSKLSSEVSKEKHARLKQLEIEKRAKASEKERKRHEIEKHRKKEAPKFVIPKKKGDEGPKVDVSRVKEFMARQEEQKREEEKKKMAEKEKLIQLRLQSNGGKASKKMGKHFGMNALDLQIRYGNDHELVEKLQKQKWREEEEQDRMASSYRDGVYKALQQKKKVEEKLRSDSERREPHRVSTSKANSLFGLSSRHAHSRDHFSPPPEEKKKKAAAPAAPPPKPRKAPVVDFQSLMQQADVVAKGGKPLPIDAVPKSKPIEKRPPPVSDRPPAMPSKPASGMSQSSSSSSAKHSSSSSSSSSSKPRDKYDSRPNDMKRKTSPPATSAKKPAATGPQKEKSNGRFQKGPTPPPMIPPAVPGKRYLPGDFRYQKGAPAASGPPRPTLPPTISSSQMTRPALSSSSSSSRPQMSSKSSNSAPSSKSSHNALSKSNGSSSSSMRSSRDDVRQPDRAHKSSHHSSQHSSSSSMQRSSGSNGHHRPLQKRPAQREPRSLIELERERERKRRREEARGSGGGSVIRGFDDYDDEDDYEDEVDDEEYDSDMDDFIDDSGLDVEELSRQEFEDTLKMVNPKYNKNVWKHREQMINERDMHSNFSRISREEAFSAKSGLIEDIREANKGRSRAC